MWKQLVKTQQELIDILKQSGFELRKWSSNNVELLKALPQELCEIRNDLDLDLDLDYSNDVIKTLGMYLYPIRDEFFFKVQPIESPMTSSKRGKTELPRLEQLRLPRCVVPKDSRVT
ncbi:hypothetical protein QZH41_008559, partial [Actinostola sp. cb2023]